MRGIITADWHLRNSLPRCRKDENWIETQKDKLNQILEIAKDKDCDVFCVGDIFDSNSDTSFQIINLVQDFARKLNTVEKSLYILAGNHDLPFHSSENIERSAIGVLMNSENIYPISYFDNVSASNFDEEDDLNAEIVFKHTLTIPQEDKNPMIDCETPQTLLKKFKNAKWIFTGDYHKNFHYCDNGRNVVNSGCLIREKSDMKDYQCGVYFVDTDENICEFISIIDSEELVDDSYITKQDERENRISEFVDKLKQTKGVSLDFVDNVRKAILINEIDDDLKLTIEELLEA